MKKTTLYLPDELKARVERLAGETRRSEVEVMPAAIGRLHERRPAAASRLVSELGEPLGENLAEKIDEILGRARARLIVLDTSALYAVFVIDEPAHEQGRDGALTDLTAA